MNVTVDISNSSDTHWIPASPDCEAWIRQALSEAGDARSCSVSLHIVDAVQAQELNEQYRGKATATNVLSFPANLPAAARAEIQPEPMGDIVICPEVLEREATQQGKSLEAHWAHLVIHGTLHLLGYVHDNEASASAMERLETNALEKLGFPNPYLIG